MKFHFYQILKMLDDKYLTSIQFDRIKQPKENIKPIFGLQLKEINQK